MFKSIPKFIEVIQMIEISKEEFLKMNETQKARILRLIAEGVVKFIK